MGVGEVIAAAALILTVSGGCIGWMMSVVKNLSSIKANTGHLAERLDDFEDTFHDISSTLRSHGERILTLEERAGMRRGMGS